MNVHLEKGDEFRELVVEHRGLIRRRGVLGHRPRSEREAFLTNARAEAAAQLEIDQLRADGWAEPGHGVDPVEREPSLEAALRANRDDAAAYSVYADWLQDRHHPMGELIALELLSEREDERSLPRIADLRRDFSTTDAGFCGVEWRRGFWKRLRLENLTGIETDPVPRAEAAFARFACAILDELSIGECRLSDAVRDAPRIVAAAAKHPWAKGLRSLELAASPDIDLAHWFVGDIATPVSTAFPNLEQLWIRTGDEEEDPVSFVGFTLPKLSRLCIESCSLSKVRLAELVDASFPSLRRLELWFGSNAYGADCTLADLAPILTGAAWPDLTELGLCNFEHEDELARTIHLSPLAAQLMRLDLSKGTMNDASALVLAEHRDRFPALQVLDVSENWLSAHMLALLRAAFDNVELRGDNQRTDAPGRARYVQIGE